MYNLVKSQSLLRTLALEAPGATCAIVVAEIFYKFHSFTLECLAFLVTWYAFSWVFNRAFVLKRSSAGRAARETKS